MFFISKSPSPLPFYLLGGKVFCKGDSMVNQISDPLDPGFIKSDAGGNPSQGIEKQGFLW